MVDYFKNFIEKIRGLYLKSKELILDKIRKTEQLKSLLNRLRSVAEARKSNLDKKLALSLNQTRLPSLKQLKYLNRFLSKTETRIIKVLSLIVTLSLIFIGVNLYLNHVVTVPAEGGEYTEGLVGSPRYLNPLLAPANDVDLDISSLVFSGLFRRDKNLTLVPDLATAYNLSQDQKIYTVSLRKSVKWNDGENLNADDVVFTFEGIQNPDFHSPLAPEFRGVKLEKVDDYTIKFTLPEPYEPFLNNLTFGILPKHLWSEIAPINANLAEYNQKPVGSGLFQFKSLTKDRLGQIISYSFIRNESYYGTKPYLKKITFKFYPDFKSAVQALKGKEIDGLNFLPKEFEGTIKTKGLAYYSFELPEYTALFFNPKNNDALKDKTVRQALAYGIDRQKMIDEILKGEGRIVNGPILPGFLGFNPDIKQYNYDPKTAGDLLDRAGWKLESGLRKNKDKNLEITLTTVDQPENYRVLELIKKNWEGLGIKINLQVVPVNLIRKEIIKPRNYNILLYSEIIGSDPDPFPFWHSSQVRDPGLNLAAILNRRVDQLLEDARKTNDPEVKKTKYLEFQNILAEEVPAIFLYNPIYTYVATDKIRGIELKRIIIPSDRFIGIENWYLNTKLAWK